MHRFALYETEWGWGAVVVGKAGVREVALPGEERQALIEAIRRKYQGLQPANDEARRLADLLGRYLRGEVVEFRCRVDHSGLTPFQQATYEATRAIPYGETRSYQWVGQMVGKPHAGRAVGRALSANPVPLIVPCHRVVRKDGSLGGFSAREGVRLKAKLLQMEARHR